MLVYSKYTNYTINIAYTIFNAIKLVKNDNRYSTRMLRITIPEDLNYSGVFDDILEKYTSEYRLSRVKTVNMGSMFRLTYQIVMKEGDIEKAMIDAIRCRNGNLEVSVSDYQSKYTEL